MATFADSIPVDKKAWLGIAAAGVVVLLLAALAIPNLNRFRTAAEKASAAAHQHALGGNQAIASYYSPNSPAAREPAALVSDSDAAKAVVTTSLISPDAAVGRKIVRTGSLEMVVQYPAEVADKIMALAESLGGYVVSSEGGGQNATAGALTIRVPAAHFEQARTGIRKLGLRVESEKIDAQDVTQQYVDQNANLRNLHAEEAQYLTILRQANTVKDMLAVSAKLSEVRGQIEQQQAEFNALSQQIETVALTISLRTEAEAQVWGLNWRPGYQLKLALRDGLESLATYATAMTTILFYLPAVLLWVGTIIGGVLAVWGMLRWAGRRWFGSKATETAAQG
jgi:Domain of unknown function (DUF4349)